jgi:hypothetical protein
MVLAKVADMTKDCKDWGHKGVSGGTMLELLAECAILLFGKGEEDLLGVEEEVQCTSGCIIAVDSKNKFDILKPKGRGVIVLVGMDVFTRAKEEKQADDSAIARGPEEWVRGAVGVGNGPGNQGHGNWLNAFGRLVQMGISLQLGFQTEFDFSVNHDAGVKGPHAGHLLAQGTNVVLHRARLERVTAGGEYTGAEMMSKDL